MFSLELCDLTNIDDSTNFLRSQYHQLICSQYNLRLVVTFEFVRMISHQLAELCRIVTGDAPVPGTSQGPEAWLIRGAGCSCDFRLEFLELVNVVNRSFFGGFVFHCICLLYCCLMLFVHCLSSFACRSLRWHFWSDSHSFLW